MVLVYLVVDPGNVFELQDDHSFSVAFYGMSLTQLGAQAVEFSAEGPVSNPTAVQVAGIGVAQGGDVALGAYAGNWRTSNFGPAPAPVTVQGIVVNMQVLKAPVLG